MKRLDENQRNIYIQYLQNHVSPKRVRHCLGVAQTAVQLAEQFSADPIKAEIAGILHDCSKEFGDSQMIQAAYFYGLKPDQYQQESPQLLHPYVSAEMVKYDLGITDEEVLNAIRRHMCGHPEMTVLDAVVNLADYIEPTRNYPDVDEIRQMARESLWETLCTCLGRTMILTIQQGNVVHPDTLYTWDALRMRFKVQKEK